MGAQVLKAQSAPLACECFIKTQILWQVQEMDSAMRSRSVLIYGRAAETSHANGSGSSRERWRFNLTF